MARAKTNKNRPVQGTENSGEPAPNAVWFKPVMFGFMLIGLVWIIVFYLSQGTLPVPSLGSWNILVGFGIAFVGFLMTTQWR
ncbi:cell division protein CrgA [Mycetocola spongiae]|uniref:cell division protein CrgA n=1 Tax=Mycetocola spongiae TaxID=2859226 RepID=UPI001CF0F9EF|nr:cell division protein CrgA [Mycetocola spongiae]UCR88231.1 cell division protein CrgA [Mycetocola spongiae]